MNISLPSTFLLANDNNETGELKKGRFSEKENELLTQLCDQYLSLHGLQVESVLSCMQTENTKPKRNLDFWRNIRSHFPHRHEEAVYRRARLILLRKEKPNWSEDEKKTLLQLINIHGPDYKLIGQSMGRLSGDVKQMHRMIGQKVRHKQGSFSEEEDEKLFKLVIKHCKVPEGELPIKDIPWAIITEEMGSLRLRKDYARHWTILRNRLIHRAADSLKALAPDQLLSKMNNDGESIGGQSTDESDSDDDNKKRKFRIHVTIKKNTSVPVTIADSTLSMLAKRENGNMSDLELLRYMRESGADDTKDINFEEINRIFKNKSQHYAALRWNSLLKSCPLDVKRFEDQIEYLYQKEIKQSCLDASNYVMDDQILINDLPEHDSGNHDHMNEDAMRRSVVTFAPDDYIIYDDPYIQPLDESNAASQQEEEEGEESDAEEEEEEETEEDEESAAEDEEEEEERVEEDDDSDDDDAVNYEDDDEDLPSEDDVQSDIDEDMGRSYENSQYTNEWKYHRHATKNHAKTTALIDLTSIDSSIHSNDDDSMPQNKRKSFKRGRSESLSDDLSGNSYDPVTQGRASWSHISKHMRPSGDKGDYEVTEKNDMNRKKQKDKSKKPSHQNHSASNQLAKSSPSQQNDYHKTAIAGESKSHNHQKKRRRKNHRKENDLDAQTLLSHPSQAASLYSMNQATGEATVKESSSKKESKWKRKRQRMKMKNQLKDSTHDPTKHSNSKGNPTPLIRHDNDHIQQNIKQSSKSSAGQAPNNHKYRAVQSPPRNQSPRNHFAELNARQNINNKDGNGYPIGRKYSHQPKIICKVPDYSSQRSFPHGHMESNPPQRKSIESSISHDYPHLKHKKHKDPHRYGYNGSFS